MKNKKKVDFYSSKKSIGRSGYVMKGKTKLLTHFKWIFKMSISMVEMLQKEIQSLCNFSILKINKIEPANEV